MTVVLLLATFLAFALIDYVLSRKKAVKLAKAEAPASAAPFLQPAFVDGFAVPEELRYHQGHAWLYRERKNLARVGVDEFAAVVAGKVEKIELPRPGQWIRATAPGPVDTAGTNCLVNHPQRRDGFHGFADRRRSG
jgi:glycine cleavage system H protein